MKLFIRLLPLAGIFLCLSPGLLRGQGDLSAGLRRTLEEELEQNQEFDQSALLDDLDRYRERPINLNGATADELTRLPGISLQDGIAILDFVDRLHPSSIEQIGQLDSLTAEQMMVLRNFTTLRRPGERQAGTNGVIVRTRLAEDLQPRDGFADHLSRLVPRLDPATGDSLGLDTVDLGRSYTGSRLGVMTRVAATYGDCSFGATFKKDPGEAILYHDTLGFSYLPNEHVPALPPDAGVASRLTSFVGAYGQIDLQPLTITLGDYSAAFGQGLVLWNSYGGSKGGDVTRSPFKFGGGIVPYRSGGESGFLRGAAVTLNQGQWLPSGTSASLFASYRLLDATLSETIGSGGRSLVTATTIRTDGLHRTHSEIRRSANLGELLYGAHLEQSFDAGGIGLTAYNLRYSLPLAGNLFYDQSGSSNLMAGVDGHWRFNRTTLSAEMAVTGDGEVGILAGAATRLSGIDIALAVRRLPARFHTPHGVGFGESPSAQRNEEGIYAGLKVPLTGYLSGSIFFDLFRHPERTFLVPFPTSGGEGYMRLDYAPSRRIALGFSAGQKLLGDMAAETDSYGRDHKYLVERTSTTVRFDGAYGSPGSDLSFRGRLELRRAAFDWKLPPQSGTLSFLELSYRVSGKLSLSCRFSLFSNDGSDAALYEIEQDLPGRLLSRQLNGNGSRLYLYGRWDLLRGVSLSANYGETYRRDRQLTVAGSDQKAAGPLENNLSVQLDASF